MDIFTTSVTKMPNSWAILESHSVSCRWFQITYDRLISTMGFPIRVRWNLYIESGPSTRENSITRTKQWWSRMPPCQKVGKDLPYVIRNLIWNWCWLPQAARKKAVTLIGWYHRICPQSKRYPVGPSHIVYRPKLIVVKPTVLHVWNMEGQSTWFKFNVT